MSEKSISQMSTRGSLSKRLLFYTLAISSAFLSASFVVLDSYIGANLLPDPFVFATSSWFIGSMIITLMMLLFAIPLRRIGNTRTSLGSFVDPNFRPFFIPPWHVLKYVLLGGAFMSFSTLFYFLMIQRFDASTFVPLMSFVIIYLLVGDLLLEKDKPTVIEIQAIVAIISGVFISSLSKGEFSLESILITLLVMNGLSAGVTISHKKATQWVDQKTRKPLDSVNIRFYSVLMATLINTVVFLIIYNDEQMSMLKSQFIPSFTMVAISMLLATLSYVFFIQALRMGKMSIVNALQSFSVIIAIPLTFLASKLAPDKIPFDIGGSTGLILKLIGALLVLTGMISLAISEVRVLVIVKVKEDGLKQIDKIAEMRGVTRVSVLAGKYDLLVTIRTRSVGKGYRQIIRKIKNMPNISNIATITIVKEWN